MCKNPLTIQNTKATSIDHRVRSATMFCNESELILICFDNETGDSITGGKRSQREINTYLTTNTVGAEKKDPIENSG
jgi:hypothetical protein